MNAVLTPSVPVPLADEPAALLIVETLSRVPAGFPSPAQDHVQRTIDLTSILAPRPLSTFLFQVAGESMSGAGIHDGDKLVVDRSIEPKHGYIVVACVDGDFTVKRLFKRAGVVKLMPANPAFGPIVFSDGQEMSVWGVVTWNLRQVLPTRVTA
ncbi:LexA family protein [Burkholderia vietnamiensis]|uniref:LexA family protein n=1 Tax=Burkholderia vietnamiensis TaxID=60552 RepID=UPI001CF3D6EF|nr:translesion error-prone DNA polymerase V autoproteolytic subunit [Burkholderia vietnamiensis]MCA8448899.1 translesion error-prone DNA polymerase V autoproteolytic subunit [Burkholderia vietnamiensis]